MSQNPEAGGSGETLEQFEKSLTQLGAEKLTALLADTDPVAQFDRHCAIKRELAKRSSSTGAAAAPAAAAEPKRAATISPFKTPGPVTDAYIKSELQQKTHALKPEAKATAETASDALSKPVQFFEKPMSGPRETGQFETSHLLRKSRLKIRETQPLANGEALASKRPTDIDGVPKNPSSAIKFRSAPPAAEPPPPPGASPTALSDRYNARFEVHEEKGGKFFYLLLTLSLLMMVGSVAVFSIILFDLPGKPQVQEAMEQISQLVGAGVQKASELAGKK